VDYEPNYSGYTLDELLDANDHIDREKYPERAQKLEDEIARRHIEALEINRSPVRESADTVLWKSPQISEQPTELSLEFHGSAREYFRIWIVNLCLTLLSLGIFSAWAKVRKKRYSYSHTTLGGTPFQYLGQPIPILKGRLIAAIGFLIYYTSTHFVASLLPYVLAAGLIVAPWVIVRSAAFNTRYSAFRNMTFHFDGGYFGAMKVLYAWGIIPAIVIGTMFNWPRKPTVVGIAFVVFAFLFPWWIRRLKKFIIEHTSYGGKKGAFFATGGQFFKIYFIAGLIMIAVLIPSGILVVKLFASTKKLGLAPYLIAAPMYAGYVLAFAYVQARIGNLVWNHIHLGPLRFQSTLRCWDLLKLYVTNALGIVASLGLLIPWAVMRTLKYRADNMRVLQEGELSKFQGSDMSSVAAVGAETIDFFDVDLSL
jgi:uncharacterized membrane protein YjgN (DUF898 family)